MTDEQFGFCPSILSGKSLNFEIFYYTKNIRLRRIDSLSKQADIFLNREITGISYKGLSVIFIKQCLERRHRVLYR